MIDFIMSMFVALLLLALAWGAFALLWPLIAAAFWLFAAGFASGGIFLLFALVALYFMFN